MQGVTSPLAERPTRPLPTKPAGHVELARYSSLARFWSLLGGAARSGRRVTLVRGDAPDVCRRRIGGYALAGAGVFLDTARTAAHLEDGFAPHPALVTLLAGDPQPLRDELNVHFELRVDFTLALTARRDLIARPEFRFVPIVAGLSSLPDDLLLDVRRLGRDELHLLIQRACGLA
ncbi:hypothetical protein K7W42_00950 [Deinococcus sp. HMF7604]|uniref:hypothetical protein n=1 Tax=Deinococcus betulae TaxID=2873312 RepID=UPI001CCBBAA4|nr:hypothetical protein [Deinococcus betulae]MBZ9749420.1 hypothetical protein [Deinococcus betulae]